MGRGFRNPESLISKSLEVKQIEAAVVREIRNLDNDGCVTTLSVLNFRSLTLSTTTDGRQSAA
jgi:hypothetical protein